MTKNLLESGRNKGFEHCIRAPLVLAVRRSNLADCLQKCLQCNVCKSIYTYSFFVWSIALIYLWIFALPLPAMNLSLFHWPGTCLLLLYGLWSLAEWIYLQNTPLSLIPLICQTPSIGAGPHILHTKYLLCSTTTCFVVSSGQSSSITQLVTSLFIPLIYQTPNIPKAHPNTKKHHRAELEKSGNLGTRFLVHFRPKFGK